MIKIAITEKKMADIQAQGHAYFVEDGKSFDPIKKVVQKIFPHIEDILEKNKFTGAAGSQIVIPADVDGSVVYIILMGLGTADKNRLCVETYRRALGTLYKISQQHKLSSLALNIPAASRFKQDPEYMARQAASILHMASYHFDKYLTDEAVKQATDVQIWFSITGGDKRAYTKGVSQGEIVGAGVNKARWWVDSPPSDLPPAEFAKNAQKIAKEQGLKITVFGEEQIKKMGMGGLAGVSAGSEQDCKLIIMEYEAKKKSASRVGIVGKGITFDSGGLSLKPPQYMETMKEDMSGAAAVLATMEAIAQLKPSVHVTAVMPLSENLPSGTATKPGDIVTFYNGKTAEVRNTDAEGRLILADALAYAVKHYKLDGLIDLATLTGACAHALGPFFAGMMGKNQDMLSKVEKAAHSSGDQVWGLPFDDDYKVAIKSPIADICNIGSSKYMAGAVTAGFFLSNFTGDVPWVHLDIAGVAFNVPDRSYFRPGATGYGVRLLIDLITQWQ